MSSPRELREQLVLDLLQKKWTSSNTYGLTPNITFGWYDMKTDGTPLLTVAEAQEAPAGGGQTGYDSISGDGSGPEQTMAGTVDCHIWTHRDDLSSANTNGQRAYNGAVTEEVARICRENAVRPTNPQTNNQPIRVISPGQAQSVAEPDEHALYHRFIPVSYLYHTNE